MTFAAWATRWATTTVLSRQYTPSRSGGPQVAHPSKLADNDEGIPELPPPCGLPTRQWLLKTVLTLWSKAEPTRLAVAARRATCVPYWTVNHGTQRTVTVNTTSLMSWPSLAPPA
jgi:hypothetical protein